MGSLAGRVAIITGAGRGLGREHARYYAAEGAMVVVNDTGAGPDGSEQDRGAAERVAAQIEADGGTALANTDDVTDWDAAAHLIDETVAHFGDLHVLVNNAGVLRDRALVHMSEEDWDVVIRVHLKGHFAPLRHAGTYWRARTKEGRPVAASVVNTSSTSGLHGNPGQANYGAAKAGIAALTLIAADELARYGVRVNGIVPAARTRLTEATPGLDEIIRPPDDAARFDEWDPANVAPLVAWLGTESCEATGRMFSVFGGTIGLMNGWTRREGVSRHERWSVEDLATALPPLLD